MEKFFLKRLKIVIETWQLGLFLIVAILGLVGFGALVEHGASDGSRASGVAEIALRIARIPADSRKITRNFLRQRDNSTLAHRQRFQGMAGFKRFKAGEDEVLLLARYDGDENRSVVDIMDLADGAVLHRYAPDVDEINRITMQDIAYGAGLRVKSSASTYMMSHPQLDEDGGIIFHGMYMPLIKIDVCSNIVWTIDGAFHHSIERDGDGNYWTASILIPQEFEMMTDRAFDDAIIQFSPDGKILYKKSLAKILVENELEHLVFSGPNYSHDPLHLNDVQPVFADGPFWRRGDVFLSLRNRSAIILFRPSTNEVLWQRQGPWLLQHDIDILNEREISVFDNNTAEMSWGESVLGVNNSIVYNFPTEETSKPYSQGYEVNDIRTITEGRSEILPDGEIFVEEQNYGRLLKMNAAGDLTWQYVNRASDGWVYVVNWARYIDEALGKHVAEIAAEKCSE